jgi:hypothetical protein
MSSSDALLTTRTPAVMPLSIVVAVWGDTAGLDECLAALERQQDAQTRVVVVSAVAVPEQTRRRFPRADWLEEDPGLLVPHLWAIGMAQSTTPIVSITTAHFTPAPDYVAAVRAAHARLDAVGVGGKIDPPRGGNAVAWATYFLRYSSYLSWDRERDVADFAGDNGSYKRAAVAAHPGCLDGGFWEQSFHRAVVAEGKTLRFVPEIRVTQQASFAFRNFMAQRFRHGLEFGRTRTRSAGRATRWFRTLTMPLVPALLLGRIAGRVWSSGRDFGPFLSCLPILFAFVLAWSAGEALGTVGGREAPLERRREGVNAGCDRASTS